MAFFNEFPHTRTYDNDLGWLIKSVKELEVNLQNFIKLNTIKYANPIIWNITTQYETNTVVIDGNTGTAYLSVQPVPAGVGLNNTDYWTPIFTLNLLTANQNITFRDDGTNVIASFASNTGDWLLWNFYLYRVTQPISLNTAYVEGFNIERFSVELFIKDYINTLAGIIGDLDDLTTSDKTSIVNAINSVLTDLSTTIGDLDNLNTSDKTSIVNAINSIINDANPDIFVSPKFYGAVGDGVTDDTTAIQQCVDDNDYVVFDGDFLITAPITLHSNMYVLGMGSIINTTEFTTSLYAEDVTNLVIDGVSFVNGSRSSSVYTTLNGNIFIYNSDNILIRNIKDTEHNKMASILLDTVTKFEITSCLITKSGYAGVMCYGNCHIGNIHHNEIEVDYYTEYVNTYGIALSCTPHSGSITDKSNQCSDIIVDSNIVYTYNNQGFWEGIDTHAGTRIKIVNNKIKGFADGIVLTRATSYDGFDTTPTYCEISGNDIVGATSIAAVRTELVGIGVYGNQNIYMNCNIKNNTLSNLSITHNGVNIGYGIVPSGQGIIVNGNSFKNRIQRCIKLRLSSYCEITNNVGVQSAYNFIEFNDIRGEVFILNNLFAQARNFYVIEKTDGLSYVRRCGNQISSAYWKDSTADVTDITDFVPDYVNVSPAGSNYHPKGMTAIKSTPASGSPEKWVCDGTTWIASANLT